MKTLMLAVLLLHGTACVLSRAEAAKILVDPNTQTAVSAKSKGSKADFWSADSRLDVKVTYDASYKPVRLILADISKATGVTLHAGYSRLDWQVRDRKMNVFVTDVSLADLMRSIARVMNFKWRRNTDVDPTTYRLIMDRTILLLKENREAEAPSSKAERFIEDLKATTQASDADLSALKSNNPYLYALASTGAAAALSKFLAEVPAARDAMICGEMVNVGDCVPPDSESTLRELLRCTLKMNALEKGRNTLSPEMVDSVDMAGVHVNLSSPGGYYIGHLTLGYRFSDEDAPSDITLRIRDPSIASNQSLWSVMLEAKNEDVPLSTLLERVNRKEKTDGMTSTPVSGDPDADMQSQSDDSTLTGGNVSIQVQRGDDPRLTIVDYESAFAKASGLSLVSDSFAQHRDEMNFTKGEMTPKAFLGKFASAFRYRWQKHEGIVELRNRDWFRKRLLQIPDAWLDKLRNAIRRTGELGLDDLAGIGLFGDEQYSLNIRGDSTLDNWNLEAALSIQWGWLSFYMKLLPHERRMLCSDTYLSDDWLDDELRATLKGYVLQRRILGRFENGFSWLAAVREKDRFVLKAYDASSWCPLAYIRVPSYSTHK